MYSDVPSTLLLTNADKNFPKPVFEDTLQGNSLIKTFTEKKSKIGPSFRLFFLMFILLNMQLATSVKLIIDRPNWQNSTLSDKILLELTQKKTFRYFWEFGHPVSGLARERTGLGKGEVITIGGSGFGLMSIVVAAERGWVNRTAAAARVDKILRFLYLSQNFHGVFPHWLNGTSGRLVEFHDDDHRGDLVESAFLMQGILTIRQYFNRSGCLEMRIRATADYLWKAVMWTKHIPQGQQVLTWGDASMKGTNSLWLVGWNEALLVYVLAAGSPTHPIDSELYHKGWAEDGHLKNGKEFYGIRLPLGLDFGGPLYFAHYSFVGLDPRGLKDKYADYWFQNVNHSRINYEHCARNPNGFKGYSKHSWGLTACTSPDGYKSFSPTEDAGTIAPTAALSSMPYTPIKSMRALRYFYHTLGSKLWGEYGFIDAFNKNKNWYSDVFLAYDQGPIILMIENYRTGLLWKLFMSCPEVRKGLRKLGFQSPHLNIDQTLKVI